MDLNYLSDSPLRLNLGNSKHKRELKNAFLKPLKASQHRNDTSKNRIDTLPER